MEIVIFSTSIEITSTKCFYHSKVDNNTNWFILQNATEYDAPHMAHIKDCNECMHIGSMSNHVIDYSIFNIKIRPKKIVLEQESNDNLFGTYIPSYSLDQINMNTT